jgi:hypothetical protein
MTHSHDDIEIDIDEYLARSRRVAVVWCAEDVQQMRPDLDYDQAWEVLQECLRVHSCESGFTWGLIDLVAASLFPKQE